MMAAAGPIIIPVSDMYGSSAEQGSVACCSEEIKPDVEAW
jgi:hypothetical protein